MMDIYCGNCDNDIGLQTNKEYNEMKQQLTQKDAIIKVLTEAVEFTRYSFVPDKVVEKCEQTLEKVKGIDGKTN